MYIRTKLLCTHKNILCPYIAFCKSTKYILYVYKTHFARVKNYVIRIQTLLHACKTLLYACKTLYTHTKYAYHTNPILGGKVLYSSDRANMFMYLVLFIKRSAVSNVNLVVSTNKITCKISPPLNTTSSSISHILHQNRIIVNDMIYLFYK